MDRKKLEPTEPIVTRIPLPASETAMVIDLPDGQKLVVGKMEHGTVIEVATWRGTGRPDSRTNRMMLGLSSSEAEAEQKIKEEQERLQNPTLSSKDKFLAISRKFFIWLFVPKKEQPDATESPKKRLLLPKFKNLSPKSVVEAVGKKRLPNLGGIPRRSKDQKLKRADDDFQRILDSFERITPTQKKSAPVSRSTIERNKAPKKPNKSKK